MEEDKKGKWFKYVRDSILSLAVVFLVVGALLPHTGSVLGTKEVLVYIGLSIVITVLALAIILLLANLGAYFGKISLGTTVFINAGDNKKEVWPNIGGYKMSKEEDLDGRRWLVPAKDNSEWMESFFHDATPWTVPFQKLLWRAFGIRFISFFWPQVHVHRFDIRKGGRRRIETRAGTKDAPLRSRMVDSGVPTTVVDSLLFTVPRPVYMEGVELAGDNSKINLLALAIFRLVIPVLPVYYLKGDFFNPLDAAVESVLVNFGATHQVEEEDENGKKVQKPLTYAHWVELAKLGEGSPIEQHLRHFNVSDDYIKRLEKAEKNELVTYIKEHLIPEHSGSEKPVETSGVCALGTAPSGIVPRFGFALVSFRIVEWEPHDDTKPLAAALLAKETQLHTAKGVREKAYGERDAKLAVAAGESGRFEQLMKSLTDKEVSPDVAARVVETMLRTENIGGENSKIVTYVEGGASASVMVNAPSSQSSTH